MTLSSESAENRSVVHPIALLSQPSQGKILIFNASFLSGRIDCKKLLPKTMKVFIDGDGCILRTLDKNRLNDYFALNKAELLQSPKGADQVVYVTCGVTQIMTDVCVSKIRTYKKLNSKLLIAGCMPDITPELLNKECPPDYQALSTRHIENIDELFPQFEVKFKDVAHSSLADAGKSQYIRHRFTLSKADIRRLSKGIHFIPKYLFYNFHRKINQKQFAFLVTSKGCDRHCTYCGIKTAVGRLKSLSIEVLLKNYSDMLSQGYNHIFFFSDDTGSYGDDTGESFAELLTQLDKISSPDVTWAFENFHAASLIRHVDILNKLVKSKRIVSIECSIQHFVNSVLKRMNRRYDADEFIRCVERLKKSFSRLHISTHFIVGFPGETEEDIALAAEYIKKASIDYYDLLEYYDNGISPSTLLKNKISTATIHQRMKFISSVLSKKKTPHAVFPVELLGEGVDRTYILNPTASPAIHLAEQQRAA